METQTRLLRCSALNIITLCMVILLTFSRSGAKLVDLDIYKDMVVDMHNSFRRKIPASNMKEMSWDTKLADKAGYWSKWCSYERHNHKHHSKYGENLFIGLSNDAQRTLFDAIQTWYDEGELYNYRPFEKRCDDTCQYTQLVWANTDSVGCAINKCGRLFNGYQTLKGVSLLVCFYAPRGNLVGEFPYQTGIACDECPRGTSCRDSLCGVGWYGEPDLRPVDSPGGPNGEDDGDLVEEEFLPQDPNWTENPAYMYAEGRPVAYSPAADRQRGYPNDLRYRRARDPRQLQREYELRRRRKDLERRRREEHARRVQAERHSRRQQRDPRRTQPEHDPRRAHLAHLAAQRAQRRVPNDYYTDREYSYRDEYNRVCSCQCRRSSSSPYPNPRPQTNPSYQWLHSGDTTQTEKYELISVHNLMRDERNLPRIHWNAELEKWSNYIIRCGEEYPGPQNTNTNFGKMTLEEDVYAFVHAWGSEGRNLSRRERHCRGAQNDYNCNRYNILMKAEVRDFACATTRCRTHRQIVCLYR
ncbi:uncharacterized protein LOC135465784 [Liolophura sinensis]|uniref:uncharacterized protein LOC135465784 n=1 Tax=Liolophura sinensis TaxID=3198878 RepID=UPI00315909BA